MGCDAMCSVTNLEVICSFVLFSPLAYGIKDETPGHLSNSSVHHIKWLESWEF